VPSRERTLAAALRFSRPLLVAALAWAASLAAPVEPASACSCVPPDPARDLADVDAAFVGTAVSRRVEERGPLRSSGDPAYWTFDVERAVKGELPEKLVVRAPVDSASCGLELRPGERVGLLLELRGGEYESSLCRQVEPDLLIGFAAGQNGRAWWPFALGGGLGLALAAAATALALRRR
jgi:hypothetical protein